MLILDIAPGDGEPFEHCLEAQEVVIGRSTRCDLRLADRFLSRRHARLYRQGEDWLIEDLGSRNGTFVNGRRLSEPSVLRPGDTVTMSGSVIRVRGLAPVTPPQTLETPSQVQLRAASDVLLQIQTPPPRSDGEVVLHRYAERLALVNEVHRSLAGPLTSQDALELILDRACRHLRPERATVYLRDEVGAWVPAACRPVAPGSPQPPPSASLVSEVAEKGMAALVLDAATDQRFADARSLVDAGVHSLVAAPLLAPEGALGFVVLSSNAAVRQFDSEDLELLVILAAAAAMRIQNLRLAEEAAEHRRLERELELARQIQLTLLPERLPEVPGYQLYGDSVPSRGVSGDYYQVVERAAGREVVLVVADVAGKGIAASLLTACLEALSSTLIEDGLAPEDIFNRLNRPLDRRTPANRFATVLLAVLEPATGRIRYANAGHAPGLVVRASGETEWLGATGVPLGLFGDRRYDGAATELGAGDLLVLYTDGYTEAEGPADEQFGDHRLAELVCAHRELPLAELAAKLESEVTVFAAGRPLEDDRTIVLLRRC